MTYVEDFARVLITLAEWEEASGEAWHVPSAPAVTMRRFVGMVSHEVRRPARLRVAPAWGIAVASLFNPTMRAVREQLYQHEQSWVVDSSKFERAFGDGNDACSHEMPELHRRGGGRAGRYDGPAES